MSDDRPAHRLSHLVKFRLGEQDHARLVSQAEAHRLRVNELARRLVTEKSRRPVAQPLVDPVILIQLQDIGLRLRQMLADGGCSPDLCGRIAALCQKIEALINHVISQEHV